MALSFCSNWGTFHPLNAETSVYPQMQPELSAELIGFHDNFTVSDTCIDPLFDSTDQTLLLSDNVNVNTHLLPFLYPPTDHFIPQLFAPQDPDPYPYPYPYPKRQRSYQDSYYLDFTPGFVPNPCLLSPEFLVPLPDFDHQASGAGGSAESVKKGNGGSLSAQSIAARQRRRKITEKTQELGKLIPGGHRMNTAEMFQAAFKYIKCLQAQVGLLELMGWSFHEKKEETFYSEELQFLVASPLIQEKLYLEEKCLIPEQFVKTLANDNGRLQPNTAIVKEINQLVGIGDQYGIKGEPENERKF